MSAVRNRKGETCEEQLRRMVKDIANDITSGEGDAAKWMENTYDIRYLPGSFCYLFCNVLYHPAKLLFACLTFSVS